MLMKTGTVSLKAQTDMRGYTPGQVIQLSTEIQNQSGRTTSTVVASLMQVPDVSLGFECFASFLVVNEDDLYQHGLTWIMEKDCH